MKREIRDQLEVQRHCNPAEYPDPSRLNSTHLISLHQQHDLFVGLGVGLGLFNLSLESLSFSALPLDLGELFFKSAPLMPDIEGLCVILVN